MEDELLTVLEGARFLRWRPSTVYEKCQRGELPHIKLPGGRRKSSIRFTRRMLEEFIRKSTVQPKVAA
jgi:hypothetical protein